MREEIRTLKEAMESQQKASEQLKSLVSALKMQVDLVRTEGDLKVGEGFKVLRWRSFGGYIMRTIAVFK